MLALAGGFVVLRWMPGKPKPAAAAAQGSTAAEVTAASEGSYESELAIMEENMLKTADREG